MPSSAGSSSTVHHGIAQGERKGSPWPPPWSHPRILPAGQPSSGVDLSAASKDSHPNGRSQAKVKVLASPTRRACQSWTQLCMGKAGPRLRCGMAWVQQTTASAWLGPTAWLTLALGWRAGQHLPWTVWLGFIPSGDGNNPCLLPSRNSWHTSVTLLVGSGPLAIPCEMARWQWELTCIASHAHSVLRRSPSRAVCVLISQQNLVCSTDTMWKCQVSEYLC